VNKISEKYTNEPLLDMFLFETSQLIEQLEQIILICEREQYFTLDAINEIFRIMHTIKGSSAMMMFHGISTLAHSIEDLFHFFREEKPQNINFPDLSDLILASIDFIKAETEKITLGLPADGNPRELDNKLVQFLNTLKEDNPAANNGTVPEVAEQTAAAPSLAYSGQFRAIIQFDEGCEMENIRSYAIIRNLKDKVSEISWIPEDILDNDDSIQVIRRDGFIINFKSDFDYDTLYTFFMNIIFLKNLEFQQLHNENESLLPGVKTEDSAREVHKTPVQQSIISVSVTKLDKLMDLVGEMVIAEAMVIQNPDLYGLQLDNFQKASQHLNKITSEIQDMVMSVRMVSLSTTFQKMHRIVRDMCKKLGKEVELEILGEETEVDKGIIEHISDPLMHLVRNALDHGIETPEERIVKGKDKKGTITLEAKNEGSDVIIIIKDDGKGLNKDKIRRKAAEAGLLPEGTDQMTDKEIFNLIFLPGFSTKDNISEYSGRGVGMDVVIKNIEIINGSISVESKTDKGTGITLKIPLTLAIIDGMNIRVGNTCYTIPTISIREAFRPSEKDLIIDPDGNEMIMIRGFCYPVIRLHKIFSAKTAVSEFAKGIIVMLEHDGEAFCVFADELIGQQQIVVKSLPEYIRRLKKINGLSGCTLLGDGSISLILDIGGVVRLAKSST
jgi:two-component system chemotaxis sensor kinase CheA